MLILMTSVFIMILLCHQCPKYQWHVYFLMFCNWASAVYCSVAVWMLGVVVFAQTLRYLPAWPIRPTDRLAHNYTSHLQCLLAHFSLFIVQFVNHPICVAVSWFLSAVNHCFAYLWVNLTLQDKEVAIMHFPRLAQYQLVIRCNRDFHIFPGF